MSESESDVKTVRLAYDRIAPDYDRQVEGDAWMRAILWCHYARLFHPGESILDVCCGTGLDTIFLAHTGMRVTGVDISPEMIARLRNRVSREYLEGSIDARVLDCAELDGLQAGAFDGVVSAFAGLSTSPDLARFARSAAQLLQPNGHMVIHMLNRFSLWEWFGLLLHLHWRQARRLGRDPRRAFTIGEIVVEHTLYFPLEAYEQYFAADFRLGKAYALGVLRPPHSMRAMPERVARALGALEMRLGSHRPWLNHGRFFVLELVKRTTDDRTA